jgi:predicted murein hydrolase (TIGR00659 family)
MLNEVLARPLAGLTLTIAVFVVASWISARTRHPLANPVLISVCTLIAILSVTGTTYDSYFASAQFIHFLLGPATVALAVPMFRQMRKVRSSLLPVAAGIVSGSAVGVASVVGVAAVFSLSPDLTASLTTKSVTAPVAMGIAGHTGALPPLAAIFAVLAGMTGAAVGPALLDRMGIIDPLARGLAMGTASHGQGTARILQESEEAGAVSGVAMGLTALTMAVVMPPLSRILI